MYEARCRRTLMDDITLQGIQSVKQMGWIGGHLENRPDLVELAQVSI